MAMTDGLACPPLFTAVIILFLPNRLNTSTVTGPSCQQIHMRLPLMGQRCITDNEVYRNYTTVPQERCMWHCLRNISCKVVNYNVVDSYCLVGHAPCVSLEPENDFVTIPITMQDPCMIWVGQDAIPPSLNDISDVVSYPVESDPGNSIVVARTILDMAKIPGKFYNTKGYFSWNGQVLEFDAGKYEVLIVSPRCDISWVNYDHGSGNALPDGAVIGGYQNGHLLYVARKHAGHMGQSARYAAGYYDNIDGNGEVIYGPDVLTYSEMEILVVRE